MVDERASQRRMAVLLAVQGALWQIPTPNLRAVAVTWTATTFGLCFIYDQSPSEAERELASLCSTYTIADLPNGYLADERVIHLPAPAKLELPDGWQTWAYMRYEPGAWGDLG